MWSESEGSKCVCGQSLCVCVLGELADLPLVQLLWGGGAQADQTVVLEHGAWALAGRGEALHLRHVVQALLDVAKVAGLGRRLVVRVRVAAVLVLAPCPAPEAALQTASLLSLPHLTLGEGEGREGG